jgi:hypothetical protein
MSMTAKEFKDGALIRLEEKIEQMILSRFPPEALANDGDLIYIRKVNGGLQWIKGNVHGGGQEWEELTPRLALNRLTKDSVGLVDDVSLEKLRDMLVAAQNPEACEIGWYQDPKGDLYQFDGKTWLGNTPSRKTVNELEYLGK